MIRNPLNTEKSIRMMESSNTLVFAVDPKDRKEEIKKAIETQFNVKVRSVRTMTSLKGKKRAIVTLDPANPAIDVATKLGMM